MGQGLPDVSVLAALSKALNISVDELLAGEKQVEKSCYLKKWETEKRRAVY